MHRNSMVRLILFSIVILCSPKFAAFAQTQPPAQVPVLPPAVQPSQQITENPVTDAVLARVPVVPQQPGQLAPPQVLIGPPFEITDVEQQFVDQILQMWESEGAKINTYNSRFERWEYDPIFGPGNDIPAIKSVGQLTYSKPDKGSFKIEEVHRYQPKTPGAAPTPQDWELQKTEVGEHWVCDGKAVYEYKHDKKQLVVQPLPPNLQGKSIVDGPLPFLFGAEAEKLKQRYWIRSRQSDPATIWLEAYPRTQADAANYHHVEVMLQRKTMQPKAIQVHMPNNKSRAVYMFDQPTINGKLDAIFGTLFNAPRTPFGWKRVVQDAPTGPQVTPHAANPQPTATR
jgi:TIGR03009 family protein